MTEALADSVVADPAGVAQYAQRIGQQTQRLTGMVDDLFQLSRISSGALRLTLSAIPLGEVVSEALPPKPSPPLARVSGCTPTPQQLAGGAGQRPGAGPGGPQPAVQRDPAHPARRHRGGRRGSPRGTGLVAVDDACGGIPEHELDRVFDVAYHGNTARTPAPADESGAGLGLAIARGLVEAHSGHIEARNHGPGCRFEIQLPLAPHPD